MVESRRAYRDLVGKPDGKNHLEDRDVDGRMIIKWILSGMWRDRLD